MVREKNNKPWNKIGVIVLVLFVWMMTAGCGNEQRTERIDGYLYGVNADGTGLVQRGYSCDEKPVEAQMEYVLSELDKSADDLSYQSPIPKGVAIEKTEIVNGQAYIYLSDGYYDADMVAQVLLRGSIVQTLVQLQGIDAVQFFVGENPMVDEKGEEIGVCTADTFVRNTGSALHSYQATTLNLYFADKSGEYLSRENVSVRYNSNLSLEKLIIEQLMKGPVNENDQAVIPSGTSLLGVSVKDGVCYVNFDEGFTEGPLNEKPEIPVYAIVNSIIDNCEIEKVQITINGETKVTYQGTIDLSQPLGQKMGLIKGE